MVSQRALAEIRLRTKRMHKMNRWMRMVKEAIRMAQILNQAKTKGRLEQNQLYRSSLQDRNELMQRKSHRMARVEVQRKHNRPMVAEALIGLVKL